MPREISVVTTSLRPDSSKPNVETNVAKAEQLLTQAATFKPDFVCLQELFALTGLPIEK